MAYFTGLNGQTLEIGTNSGYGPNYAPNSAFGQSNIVDWLGGTYGAKEQAARQAYLDEQQWLRNEASAKANRDFQEYMENTKVQRAMKDIEAAGLNPWLAVQSAGFGGAVSSGSMATSAAGQASAGTGSSGLQALGSSAIGLAAIARIIAKLLK